MGSNSPVSSAGDADAMTVLLRDLQARLDTSRTSPYVNIGGRYRLEVDAAGNLVATEGATGRTQVIMATS